MRTAAAKPFCRTIALLGVLSGNAASPLQPALARAARLYEAPHTLDQVQKAVREWQAGRFAKVRALLKEFQSESIPRVDPSTLEVALRYLADAALLDRKLDRVHASQIASRAIERILDHNPLWLPPRGIHSDEFYTLSHQLRAQRELRSAASCVAERQACNAELAQLSHERQSLRKREQKLKHAINEQVVVVEHRVARNRAAALLPGGIGHFYNGRPALGFSFLAAEGLLGATALSLFLYRSYGLGCKRHAGFAKGSLHCDVPPEQGAQVRSVRNAEQVVGILFLSSLAIDVLVAQITFRSHSVTGQREIKRGQLSRRSFWFNGRMLGMSKRF